MKHFTKDTTLFLQDLMQNNSREWFNSNRDRYTVFLIDPFKQLVTDLAEFMLEIDGDLVVDAKVDKTIARINRDTRFAKDKSPYKDHLWLTFKRKDIEWKSKPAFFFEVDPVGFTYGMGMFMATPKTMKSVRGYIDRDPIYFEKLLKGYRYKTEFETKGNNYARMKSEHSDIVNEFYFKKNIYFTKSCSAEDGLYSENLYLQIMEDFKLLVPIYNQLYKMIEFRA